jgi:hypothetical protein
VGIKYLIKCRPRAGGSHTVHREGCPFLAGNGNEKYLGCFEYPGKALEEGRKYYERADFCVFCMKEKCGGENLKNTVPDPLKQVPASACITDSGPGNILICCIN